MDLYLVMACCGHDDIPLRIFCSEKRASDYANSVSFEEVVDVAWNTYGREIWDCEGVVIIYAPNGRPDSCVAGPFYPRGS